MGFNWKDIIRKAKRQLEDQQMKEVLETRVREREAQRAPSKKRVLSRPVPQAPKSPAVSVSPKSTLALPPMPVRNAPLPPALPWIGSIQKFNIGIDFGTSSTKVCARQHKGVIPNDPEPIYLEHLDSSNSYLCPSTVLIKNGRLYFGHEAERQATSDVVPLRHLKSCLACEVEAAGATGFSECASTRDPGTSLCTGLFNYLPPLSASQLVTLYLGWVMREARGLVSGALGVRPNVTFTYHLGLPLEKIDESPSFLSAYQKISYQAWRVSEGIIQGLDVNQAVGWLNELTNELVPSPENSPVQLAPEIAASLVPFLHGCVRSVGPLAPGLYGLVDIGAWTTDVAMFRYSSDGVISFPVTKVRRNGCNLIDEKLRSGLLELVGASPDRSLKLLAAIRVARENNAFDQYRFNVARYRITPPATLLDCCLRMASGKIWRQFLETVKDAHTSWLERYDEKEFSNFRVFILGGGSNIEILAKPPDYFDTQVTRITSVLPGIPANFKAVGTNQSALSLSNTDYRRLVIAHGLAFSAGTWPEVNRPSQVEPMIRAPRRDSPTSEELGYDEK